MLNGVQALDRDCRIVLISGFESFNVDLYKKAGTPVTPIVSFVITIARLYV